MNSKALFSGIALVAAGLAVWIVFLRGDSESPGVGPQEPANGSVADVDAPEIEPRTVDAPIVVDPDEVPEDERLEMPDGTWVRALNGVKNPAPLNWPPEYPYSPVVRVETYPDGTQWYRHADGSAHTTVMSWRKDLGREDPQTMLANPTATLPMHPDEVPGPRLPQGGR